MFLHIWTPIIQIALTFAIFTLLWSFIFNKRLFRIGDFNSKNTIRYPPIWAISILGFCIYMFLIITNNKYYLVNGLKFNDLLISIILLGSSMILILVIIKIKGKKIGSNTIPKSSIDKIKNKYLLNNLRGFFKWLNKEEAIVSPDQDLFDYKVIAKRCAKYICEKDVNTIGIDGVYGSGKTSVINLIRYYIYNREDIFDNITFRGEYIYTNVDGWGLEDKTIDEHILTVTVQELNNYADCLSITSLPSRYQYAMEGINNPFLNMISPLIFGAKDSIAQLKKIDNILFALKMRIVIFIEDVDRNDSTSNKLGSLLDKINQLSNISFILTLGESKDYLEIVKRVCNHVESIA